MIESSRANKDIRHLIVCTGGAQDYLIKAHMYGADVLVGEISERTTHEARELGVHYIGRPSRYRTIRCSGAWRKDTSRTWCGSVFFR